MAQERILFQNESATVTPHRAYLDGHTYRITDLLSVSIQRRISQNKVLGVILLTIGISIWTLGLLFWYYGGSALLQPFLLGAIFFGIGFWQGRETSQSFRYNLQIIDSRGKSIPFTSMKRAELEEIATALQAAMDQNVA